MREDNAGSGQLHCGARPITFTVSCAFFRPHLRNAGLRRAEQIVYVPVKAFLSAEVALHPSS